MSPEEPRGADSLEGVRDLTRAAYDRVAQRYDELFRNELVGKAYDRDLLEWFADGLGRGARVCDAGCGPCGHVARLLAGRGLAVVGVDLSPECLRRARRDLSGSLLAAGDLARLPFSSGAFAGAVAYYSLIHTPKRHLRDLLGEIRRVLAPSGRLLAAVKEGTGEGYEGDLIGESVPIFFARFSKEEVGRALEGAGFALERLERRDPYPFEIPVGRIFAVARRS
jgi:SAM-dependent methyltransferase